ncbi:ISAs1 family transposase [Streptomyces sp. NBC_01378]|uniref:ISAs1 family transposase n=1 Tax=Streptomyces sp. NBC_01378 TaxID=2903844 RepID=UPI00324D1FC9
MPAAASSPIPAVLVKLGPLEPGQVADLRPYFDSIPDPRSRRGRWYSLTAILMVCACAVVSGARSIDELAEWGARASGGLLAALGVRRHPLRWRRTPSSATIGRVLIAVDGDALDAAVGAYLTDRHRTVVSTAHRRAIAVDGKTLKGSARLDVTRRHLLSAVSHTTVVTLAQAEVGAKTNETTHFKPLLAPLDLAGTLVTFDALHSVKANITWLVETKKAHYIAVIKTNQPTAHSQLATLPWRDIAVQHTHSEVGHGRRESRSIKTCGIADELGGIAFPHAKLAIRVHRRRRPTGSRESRESVYAVTSLEAHQTSPADLAAAIRGHWGVENSSHHIRDVTFAEDASTVHTGAAPRAMATFRNLAIGVLKTLGAENIAKTTRAIRDEPRRALPILGIINNQDTHGT